MKNNILIVIGISLLALMLLVFVVFAATGVEISDTAVSVSFLCASLFTLISIMYYDSKGALIKAFESEKLELYILAITGVAVPIAILLIK